jgi:hypothetical protein
MITHRSLEMCSSRTLFGFAALLAWPSAAQRPQVREVQNGKPCPTRRRRRLARKSTGGLSGPVEAPLIARKPTDRQVTEEQKADYEKAVVDYMKAKKGGTIPGEDCSKVASAFRRLADQVPALLEARSNEAAVDLECGKKGEAVSIWKRLSAAAKPFAPALANLGYVAGRAGTSPTRSRSSSVRFRLIPGAAPSQPASTWPRFTANGLVSRAAPKRSRSTTAAVKELRRVLAVDGNSLQAYAGLCFIYFDLDLPEAAKLVGAQAIKRAQEIATGKFEDEATRHG